MYKNISMGNMPQVWRDGNGVISYKGKLWSFMGWNPVAFPSIWGHVNTPEVFSSSDNGITWDGEADFLGRGIHTFGLEELNGFLYIFGTDWQGVGLGDTPSVWKFDGNTYTKLTNDWGAGENRVLTGTCKHNGYLYIIGGQSNIESSPIFYNDIWRSLDGITWEKVADLPIMMHNRSYPCMRSFKGRLYVYGGFSYITNRVYFKDVFVSDNGGLSWDRIGEIPVASSYQNCAVFDEKLWLLDGYGPAGSTSINRIGIHWSEDGAIWNTLPIQTINPTHATGFAPHNNKLFIVHGNETNQLAYVNKM